MNHWLAKKMFRIHGFCFDCTVDYEANLTKLGKYEEYEKAMMQGNVKEFAKDLEQYIIGKLEESSDFVTEQGDVEDWSNNSNLQKEKILKDLASFAKQVNQSLEK